MEQLILEIHEDVVQVVEKIRELSASEVELVIPEGSVLFENSLNLKLLKKEAEKLGKTLVFTTPDALGLTLIDMIDGHVSTSSHGDNDDFVSREVSYNDAMGVTSMPKEKRKRPIFNFAFLRNLRLPKLPKIKFSGFLFVIPVIIILGGLGYGAYRLLWVVPKAEIKITVNSQPLVKSIELSVDSTKTTDADSRVLAGKVVTASTTKSKSSVTTGEKVVGDKAEGKIKIINYTESEKKFSDGEELYSKDDDDLFYVLDDDVTVPAGTSEIVDNTKVITPGTAEVDVTADKIGKKYNLDKDETLEFDDHDKEDYIAKVSEDIDGGNSDTIQVVIQEDLDNLSTALTEEIDQNGSDSLNTAVESGWVLINGAVSQELTLEEFSNEVGDETDNIEVTQTVAYHGLVYNEKALTDLLESLLKSFVPDGFELSSTDRDVNVEILGNTDATVLNTTKADLQVTIKSYVVPEVNKDDIRQKLVGAKFSEAEKILGSIRNINNYQIDLNPNIPLLGRLPNKEENINLVIERE